VKYTKPEIATLGDANVVIQGPKNNPPEGSDPFTNGPTSFEIED